MIPTKYRVDGGCPCEDGIIGGQGRTRESLLRDGYVQLCLGIAGVMLIVGTALWLAFK